MSKLTKTEQKLLDEAKKYAADFRGHPFPARYSGNKPSCKNQVEGHRLATIQNLEKKGLIEVKVERDSGPGYSEKHKSWGYYFHNACWYVTVKESV